MMILTHSPTTQAINKALLVARQACSQVRPKEAVNPHFKNKFMPLAEVLRITDAPLMEAGVLMLQAQGREAERADYVTVETRLIHASSGEYYSAIMSMRPKNEGCQEALSCATYMKRSCLASLMGLSLWGEDDDAETATSIARPTRSGKPQGYDALVAELHDVTTGEALDILKRQPKATKLYFTKDASQATFVTELKNALAEATDAT